MSARVPYQQTYRRTLLDMHIPDWDSSFLSKYEPSRLADLYAAAGIQGALYYCKSHMGLNYWPAPVGGIHPAAKDRDLVGELHECLRERDIAPAAYHSVIFDNWAIEHHPDWAIKPATTLTGPDVHLLGARYGTACANNPEYRAYEHTQIRELVRRYDFDALWIDMAFWTAVCVCDVCRNRFRVEDGAAIPLTVDWSDPDWIRFQTARERWIEDFYTEIVDVVHAQRPDLPITHNLAPGLRGWFTAQKVEHGRHDTFVAGDLYGGRDEQLMISKLMWHLTEEQPAEFMTSRTLNLRNHVLLKSEHEMRLQALASTAHSSAFLFIDAIDPIGTVNDGVYARIGRVFAETAQYEPFLGGRPIEDVAIYYSDDSRVDPRDGGRSLSDAGDAEELPHVDALLGASRLLQRAHIPFGVITGKELHRLSEYRAIVLPDVLRMTEAEIEAFRGYVAAGGRLYASGRTSLLHSDGRRSDNFALGDVFGVRLDGVEDGSAVFLRETSDAVRNAVHPERYLGHGFRARVHSLQPEPPLNLPRLASDVDGRVLATLTLPYGYPSNGSAGGRDFASIHSSPPWEDRDNPAIVEHVFGAGRCVYSAMPIESGEAEANASLFAALIRGLLDNAPTIDVATESTAWITAFDQPEQHRVALSVLRYETEPPAGSLDLVLRYRPAAGRHVHAVRHAVTGRPRQHRAGSDGSVEIRFGPIEVFDLFLIEYETTDIP